MSSRKGDKDAASSARLKARWAERRPFMEGVQATAAAALKLRWQDPEFAAPYIARAKASSGANLNTGQGAVNKAKAAKKRLTAARRALSADEGFKALWRQTQARLRIETPYRKGAESYIGYLSWLGKATTADPALREYTDDFMRLALATIDSHDQAA